MSTEPGPAAARLRLNVCLDPTPWLVLPPERNAEVNDAVLAFVRSAHGRSSAQYYRARRGASDPEESLCKGKKGEFFAAEIVPRLYGVLPPLEVDLQQRPPGPDKWLPDLVALLPDGGRLTFYVMSSSFFPPSWVVQNSNPQRRCPDVDGYAVLVEVGRDWRAPRGRVAACLPLREVLARLEPLRKPELRAAKKAIYQARLQSDRAQLEQRYGRLVVPPREPPPTRRTGGGAPPGQLSFEV